MLNQHSIGCRPKLSNGQGASSVGQDEEENKALVTFLIYVKVILGLCYCFFKCPKGCGRGRTLEGLQIHSHDLFSLIIIPVLALGVEIVKKQLLLQNNSHTERSPGKIEERFPPVKQHKVLPQCDGSDPFLDFCSSIWVINATAEGWNDCNSGVWSVWVSSSAWEMNEARGRLCCSDGRHPLLHWAQAFCSQHLQFSQCSLC